MPTIPTPGDEAGFLAAVYADPRERTTRLAYADWLQDRDDARHELVRVCEAMREAPVWSDSYWELRARRNALWVMFPLGWVEATGYDGSRYDPVFQDGVPASRRVVILAKEQVMRLIDIASSW